MCVASANLLAHSLDFVVVMVVSSLAVVSHSRPSGVYSGPDLVGSNFLAIC